MKKNTKHKNMTRICMIILFTVLLCFITLEDFITDSENHVSAGSADVSLAEKQPYVMVEEHKISLWEKDGKYYAFLPAAYKNTELKPEISEGIELSSIVWMYSEHIPAVFINTDSGTSEHINSDKNVKESGTVTVLEADGTVSLRHPLEYIKGRGNTSYTEFDKKPYQIKLTKSVPFLGMDSGKKWIFISNAPDASLLRNALARKLANHLGLPQSEEGTFIDLYLNGEYVGNYYVVEKIEIKENRLPITDLEEETKHLNRNEDFSSYETAWTDTTKSKQIPKNPKDITGGYLIERDFDNRFLKEVEINESYFITEGKEHFIVRSPEYASQEQIAYIEQYTQSAENAILSPEGIDGNTGKSYEDLIDVDSFVRKYLLEEVTANYDGGVASSYFYKDSDKKNGKLYAGPVWDYDISFGNAPSYLGYLSTSPNRLSKLSAHIDSSVWFHNLYSKPEVYEKITSCYVNEISPYLTVLADEILSELSETTAASAEMDKKRWEHIYIENGYPGDRNTEIAFLEDYIHGRKEFLDKAWIKQVTVHQITLQIDGITYATLYTFYNETLPELPDIELEGAQFMGWVSADSGMPPEPDMPVQSDMVFHAVIE